MVEIQQGEGSVGQSLVSCSDCPGRRGTRPCATTCAACGAAAPVHHPGGITPAGITPTGSLNGVPPKSVMPSVEQHRMPCRSCRLAANPGPDGAATTRPDP